jgi:hypothetical protein
MTDGVKNCPVCGEEILAVAKKCRHCREYLDPAMKVAAKSYSGFELMAAPVGRPTSAIVSGYTALFGIVPILGLPFSITAIASGVAALRAIKRDPSLHGRGRAWFGIVLGSLMSVVSVFFVVVLVVAAVMHEGGRRG